MERGMALQSIKIGRLGIEDLRQGLNIQEIIIETGFNHQETSQCNGFL